MSVSSRPLLIVLMAEAEKARQARDRALEVGPRLRPARLAEHPPAQNRLRDQPLQPREAAHFGVPPAQQVVRPVVGGVGRDRPKRKLPDLHRHAHPLLEPPGEGHVAEDGAERERGPDAG